MKIGDHSYSQFFLYEVMLQISQFNLVLVNLEQVRIDYPVVCKVRGQPEMDQH